MRSDAPPPPPPPPQFVDDEDEVIALIFDIVVPGVPDVFCLVAVGGNDSDDDSNDGGSLGELSPFDENEINLVEPGGPLSEISNLKDGDAAAPLVWPPPPLHPPPPHANLLGGFVHLLLGADSNDADDESDA